VHSPFCNLYSLQSKVEFVTDITLTPNHIDQCLVCSRFKEGRYIQVEQAGIISLNIPLLCKVLEMFRSHKLLLQ
jgi:hypothetical protein